jgi:hypothetical protein
MNMLVKKISLTLVLSASTLTVFANPGQGRSERDAVRAVRQQQDAAERNEPQAGRTYQSPEFDRSSSEESFKKQSRLSPEERRALRRQINEAGQDLYIRKP